MPWRLITPEPAAGTGDGGRLPRDSAPGGTLRAAAAPRGRSDQGRAAA